MAEYISFQPSDNCGNALYTGTGAVQTISGVGFQPDFTWIKERNGTDWHCLNDTVRGYSKYVYSNSNAAEATFTDRLTSWNADGFVLGAGVETNTDASTYASWSWRMGTTSGLTGGTITPSGYSINATAGQSIIAYTGTAVAATLPHGLGVAPQMIIQKNLADTENFQVYHVSLGATKYILLNTEGAQATQTSRWNDTAPTSTLFSIGTDSSTNGSGEACVAYCFAPIKGYSKFGNYMGMGGADGPFVYTGFRPNWLLIKSYTNDARQWYIFDGKNKGYNVSGNCLIKADGTEAEDCDSFIDILSNGFKIRTTTAPLNQDTSEFLYAAFAEFPIVSSNDVPGVAR